MGWCSGTQIMDAALEAANALVERVLALAADIEEGKSLPSEFQPETVRKIMAPYVATIAEGLRDGDWDCQRDSKFYDLYPQEMEGWDDQEYVDQLREQISDSVTASETEQLSRKLVEVMRRIEKSRI